MSIEELKAITALIVSITGLSQLIIALYKHSKRETEEATYYMSFAALSFVLSITLE